jgi:Ca2+-binding EF-hand superfamily protein
MFFLGLISISEVRFLCYDMGYYLSDAQVDWARTLIDKDGSGEISYAEFSSWWQNPLRFDHLLLSDEQLDKLHQITELFRSYDKKNQGQLDKKQFEELFQELIKKNIMEQNQANQFDEIDRSQDGKINFNELIAWFYEQGTLQKLGILPIKTED